jgi:hypothetical protein
LMPQLYNNFYRFYPNSQSPQLHFPIRPSRTCDRALADPSAPTSKQNPYRTVFQSFEVTARHLSLQSKKVFTY